MTSPEWEKRYTMAIARNIASIREHTGMTIDQFAKACDDVVGIPGSFKANTMQALFAGKRKNVTVAEIAVFAQALSVPLAALLMPVRGRVELPKIDGSPMSLLEAWGQITGLYRGSATGATSKRIWALSEFARAYDLLLVDLDLLEAADNPLVTLMMDPELLVERARYHLAECKEGMRVYEGFNLYDENDPLMRWINSTDPDMLTRDIIRDFAPKGIHDAAPANPAE